MTARKPPPLPLEYGAQAYIGDPGDGEIRIFANNDGSGDMSLSPRAARALAHWLTLAAEYAESLASNGLPDPREALALVVATAEDTVRSGAAEVDALLGKPSIVFPSVPPSRPPPPMPARDPFAVDALEEFLDAQIGRTGALK